MLVGYFCCYYLLVYIHYIIIFSATHITFIIVFANFTMFLKQQSSSSYQPQARHRPPPKLSTTLGPASLCRGFHQVLGPPCGTLHRHHHLRTIPPHRPAVFLATYMCPAHCHFYFGDLGSSADFLIYDSITQMNSKHTSLNNCYVTKCVACTCIFANNTKIIVQHFELKL